MSVFKGFFKGKKFNKRTILTKVNIGCITATCLLGAYTFHLLDENDELKSELQWSIDELNGVKASVADTIAELDDEINNLRKENSDLINQNEELSNEVSELSRQNESYNLKLNNKDNIINEQKQEIKNLKKSNSNFNEVSRGGDYQKTGNYMTFRATAYTKNCYKCSGITKSGINLHELDYTPKLIAADPSVLPIGTKVEIKGMGIYTVEDTGGNIINDRIDILFPTKKKAFEFGRKEVKLKVLK